ncbi:MAG: hypothetical protein WA941_12555 [Nitrososphaeraceae archaeon]
MASKLQILFGNHRKIKPQEEKPEYSDETLKLLEKLKKKHSGSISTPKNINVI